MKTNKERFKKVTKMYIDAKVEQGEMLETQLRRMIAQGEPIQGISPMIYTKRSDGVLPQYDIRTDRFEIAQTALDNATKSDRAKREDRINQEKQAEQSAEQAN